MGNIKRLKNKIDLKASPLSISFSFVILFMLENLFAYFFEFSLGISSVFQVLIAILNTFALGWFFYLLPLFIKNKKGYLFGLFLGLTISSLLLLGNIYYYREFSDFLTVDTIVKAGANSSGLSGTITELIKPHDFIYFIPYLYFIFIVFYTKNETLKKYNFRLSMGLNILSVVFCSFVLFLAEVDRPQLLSRSFDNNYLVKYLGLAGFTSKSLYDYKELSTLRADATESELSQITNYLNTRKSTSSEYSGVAKNKNVVYIHLESFQQFLIDYKLTDENGVEHEVTPFLNKIFHSSDSISFDNAFNQVGQGKTSDAEMMIENSLFGSSSGSAMVKFGTDNTFYSAPTLFKTFGYTTSVFHGNIDTFWNRNNAYKSFGYDNFYSLKYFKDQTIVGYGIKDSSFFNESFDMYEKINGLKYSKFIPVSNHFPYLTNELNSTFPAGNSGDETVDNYFITANYMDKQIEEFYNKLVATGEASNTIFIFYGDHYGISNSRSDSLNKILKLTDNWTGYNNAMMQRVPLIFNIPNSNINSSQTINHTYVGQIDILPTLLNLMGISDSSYTFIGQNVFGNFYDNIVEFRDGGFVTPKYTYYKNKVYYTNSGEEIDLDTIDETTKKEIESYKESTNTLLKYSDSVLNKNLLKFKYEEVSTNTELTTNSTSTSETTN